ncbi:MAG: helix-turn-helix domain-containing protein [Chloroflexota bacterium]|nr:helix-turn-helix domain-containing protein [Chloroflexota bacterium]
MIFELDARLSDSPFVDQVWQARSVRSGMLHSIASNYFMMVVTLRDGKSTFTVRGPETKATPLFCDADGEWMGINFRVGAFMPHLPVRALVDRDLTLPGVGERSFCLDGTAWQFPNYENADTFVDRLVREGLLVREPVVDVVLQGQLSDVSTRSVQRRFVRATGLTRKAIQQIERARTAMTLLQRGVSILDTVHEAGYCDQPHLTRSLKRLLGQTPAEIVGSTTLE